MKHAGIHWPENANGEHPNVETILNMPGIRHGCTLICSPSARYWYRQARGTSPLVVWRAIPRQGKLPAQLNWIGKAVADECLNLWDEQPHGGIEHFTPLNELQFVRESGESFRSYTETASKLSNVRIALRQRFQAQGQTVRLMFSAWVPMDDMDRLAEWEDEARQWDTIGLHCYGSADTMRTRYDSYRAAFPNHPIFVGEHNANHEGHDERAILEMWADVANTDPGLLGCAYYIWETNNAGEHDLSIWGNPDRLHLFTNPPVVAPAPPAPPAPEPLPEPEMPELPRGIDVASYQGYPDWPAVAAAGYAFAITKATEDTGYVNPTFAHNWGGIKAAGMCRGAYHFARPGFQDATAEANYFLDVIDSVGGLETGDLLALDIESGSGDMGRWALDFLRVCELRCGFKPLVYTGRWFMEGRSFDEPELAEYGLWLAAYQGEIPAPPVPWESVAFWQYSSSGQVPGIAGDVDMNVFNGTADRIALYGKPGTVEPEEPAESSYAVGPGIAAKMVEHGDSPAANERYIDDDWSEAPGLSGARYVYLKATNRVYRHDPAA